MTSSLLLPSGQLDLAEINQLLESVDIRVVEETVALVRDNLGSGNEPWLLNGLVEFYIQSGNCHARDLLCMVRHRQHKVLLHKIDDYLQKVTTRLKALNLLGYVIRGDPPWVHHILPSKTFQSVLKCLQVDTDLPTVTSALYAVATIMPKVASQVPPHLSTICAVFVRLVSWHSIQPAGANEGCLIHLYRGVYVLFLCLYGMFPCYFMKYLQQYFQPGNSKSGNISIKGCLSDGDKLKIFESSVAPMFDQVRLHPRLIMDSSAIELSNQRWRKMECQEIVADISKLALDEAENAAQPRHVSISDVYEPVIEELSAVCLKHEGKSHGNGDDIPPAGLIETQESVWSPSIEIGLSTPPLSRALSPSPGPSQGTGKAHKMDDQEESRASGRPLTLSMPPSDSFVPNRPHDTSSGATTPLKQLVSFFSQSSSVPQCPTPQKERTTKSSGDKEMASPDESSKQVEPPVGEDVLDLRMKSQTSDQESGSVEAVYRSMTHSSDDVDQSDCNEGPPLNELAQDLQHFSPPHLMEEDNPCERESNTDDMVMTSAQNLLNLVPSCNLVGKSPNQLLDEHLQTVVEAYTKYSDKMQTCTSNDAEWMQVESSPELLYLRSQVIQMHSAMLFERHRLHQHALRSRKLMRKLYDTTALEEKNSAMASQLKEKCSEIEDHRSIEASYRSKLKSQEEQFTSRIDELVRDVDALKKKNKVLAADYQRLQFDKTRLDEECETLKSDSARLAARSFALEEQLKMNRSDKGQIVTMETRIQEMQSRLLEVREANCILEDRIKEAQGAVRSQTAESNMLAEAYRKDLDSAKANSLKKESELDITRLKLDQAESNLKRKEEIIAEQKKYLEDIKSLARSQMNAVEAKYKAQKMIGQRLEIQLLDMYARLTTVEAMEGELALRGQLPLGTTPINTGYDESMDPYLTPPVPGSLLADESQWMDHVTSTDDKTEDSRAKD